MFVKIENIVVHKRLRDIDTDKVKELADSIKEVGLLCPVLVTKDNILVAGNHRIEAYKLLGLEAIETIIIDKTTLLIELAEIDENLIRNELHFIEEGDHFDRRKEIYEELYPKTKQGGDRKSTGIKQRLAPLEKPSFVTDTASKTGKSERTVREELQISRNISPELKKQIKATNTGEKDALKISRMEPEEQIKVVEKLVNGAKSVKACEILEVKELKEQRLKEEIKGINPIVYNIDCNSFIDKMPMCDLLLTDPPYLTDIEDIESFVNKWLYKALDKVKDTGRAYIFIGAYPNEVKAYLNANIPQHIKLEQILIWTYKNTLGNNPKDKYKLNYQDCLYFKGINANNLDCPITNEQWAVQEINAPDGRLGDRYHTWQKPIEIADRFIRHSTKEKDIILDPFCCTGTFVLSANKLGRVGYGCDIDKANLDIAVKRGCKLANL